MAAWLLAFPQVAGAAGLGRLVVLSAMGQPFRAEIDLLSYRDDWSAKPRMAPPDAYQVANFRYSPALAGSRLTIKKQANGRDYIEVASPQAVNEPFVYLLIELDWNGARMVRAYTALLDPPGFGPMPAVSAPLLVPELRSAPVAQPGLRSRTPATGVEAYLVPVAPKESAPVLRPPKVIAAAPIDPALAGRLGLLEDKVSASAKTLSGLLDRVALMEAQVQRLQRMIEAQNARAAAAAPSEPQKPVVVQQSPTTQAAVVQKEAAVLPTPAAPKEVVQREPAVSPPAAPKVDSAPAPLTTVTPPPAIKPSELPAVKTATAPVVPVEPVVTRRRSSVVNEALLVLAGGSLVLVGWLVYLMWGRSRKPAVTTEDILVKMLDRDPKRDDVQLKLLEIYAERGDKTAYQNMAVRLHKLTGAQGEVWFKAATIGHALDPGNPLYAHGRYGVMASSAGDAHAVRH